MLRGLLFGLFGLLWIVPQAVGSDFGVITTMDPQLTKDWYLFHHPHAKWKVHPAIRKRSVSDDSLTVRVILYFDPKEGDLQSRVSGWRGVVIYPQSYVPPVGGHPWGFYMADVSMPFLDTLLSLGIIKRAVAAYRPLYPLNNRAAAETGALWAREGELALTGRGVRIGVLDSGFQLTHPDLPAPAEAMDYADYPDTNENVTDRVSGHGTHVAGTLFGRGTQSGGLWSGMAPDAEPIYFKIGNDTNAWASTAAVVGALKGCVTWANAQIISMSYGGWDGFNDGSSPEEQTVDWVVSQGVSVFMSAGNSAVDGTHFTASVEPGDTLGPIPIVVRFAGDSIPWSLALSWWDGADTSVHRSLGLLVRNSEGRLVGFEVLPQVSSPRGTEYREFLASEFLPVDSTFYYYVFVFNRSDSRQPFHLWIITNHWFMRFVEPSS
ncbi:MAG: S8 family peptidase, partial [bacterium]